MKRHFIKLFFLVAAFLVVPASGWAQNASDLTDPEQLLRKSHEYFEQAMSLKADERFDEARQLFEESIRLTERSEVQGYIEGGRQHVVLHDGKSSGRGPAWDAFAVSDDQAFLERVEIAYNDAVALYKQKKYKEAKTDFETIEDVSPNYKAVRSYLQVIEEDIARNSERVAQAQKKSEVIGSEATEVQVPAEQTKQAVPLPLMRKAEPADGKLDAAYAAAVRSYSAGRFEEAKQRFEEVAAINPDYKEVNFYLSGVDRDIRVAAERKATQVKEKVAGEFYSEAMALYNRKDFERAREKFLAIQSTLPDYKNTRDYLFRIDQDVRAEAERKATQAKEKVAGEFYSEAVTLYNQKDFEGAKAKFFAIQNTLPDYKNTRNYLSHIDEDARAEAERKVAQAKEKSAGESYSQAVAFYNQKDFESAKEKFLALQQYLPDYKNTRNYLSRIEQDIQKQEEDRERRKEEEKQKALFDNALALYKAGRSFYSAGKWDMALAKFSELNNVSPDFKDTRALMDAAKDRIAEAEARKAMAAAVASKPLEPPKPPAAPSVDDKVLGLYKAGVNLFKAKKYQEARERFLEVKESKPGYRSTEEYLKNIDDILNVKKDSPVQLPPKEASVVAVAPKIRKVSPAELAAPVYREAVGLYNQQLFDQAKVKFEEVQAILPGYKSTWSYLDKISRQKPKPPVIVPAVSAVPAASVVSEVKKAPEVSSQDSQKVKELSRKSSEIYRQIKALSEDKEMGSALKTFAQVDRIISNLEAEQKRLADQVAEQQKREQEAALRQKKINEQNAILAMKKDKDDAAKLKRLEEEKAEHLKREQELEAKAQEQEKEAQQKKALEGKIESFYQQAVTASKEKRFVDARTAFAELEKLSPGYKDSAKLLTRLEREEGEFQLSQAEAKDRGAVVDLAERASSINIEVVQLTEQRNYEEVRKKFDELGGILREIQGIKNRMMMRRREFASLWEGRAVTAHAQSQKEPSSPQKLISSLDARIDKARARTLFREGEQFYSARSYPEAKAKFLEASMIDPSLRAANTYVVRINRILDNQDFEVQKENNRKQTRTLEHKQEVEDGIATDQQAEEKNALQVYERAKELLDIGTEMYRDKRYREARIKFEELLQIGDEKQQKIAKRYLDLIEKGMVQEKDKIEKERQAERDRYLRERRDQDRVGGIGGNGVKPPSIQERDLTRAERELEIQRLQELRAIEKENMAERDRVIKESSIQDDQADHAEKVERSKFRRERKKQDGLAKSAEVLTPVDKIDRSRSEEEAREALALKAAPKEVPAVKAAAGEKVEVLKPTPEQVRAEKEKSRKEARRQARIKREKAVISKEEEKYRRLLVKERAKFMREKELLDKAQRELDRQKGIRRETAAVRYEAKKELTAEAKPVRVEKAVAEEKDISEQKIVVEDKIVPEAKDFSGQKIVTKKKVVAQKKAVPAPAEPVKDLNMKPATAQDKMLDLEKKALAQQQAKVRKDFDAGVERLYAEALVFYKKRLYEEARQNFLQVDDMISGYKKTRYYLSQIEKALAQSQKKAAVSLIRPVPVETRTSQAVSSTEESRSKAVAQALDALDGKTSQ